MPLPAGTGLDRRNFLARTAGLALAVYGGSAFLPRAFEEGIAAAAAAGPQKVLVSVFLDGGADSLSMLFPDGDPLYRKLRPRLALPASAGCRSPRTAGSAGIPRSRRSRSCTARARSAVMPGVGYTGPTSRTSPHATSGRSARRASSSARAGSAATSTAAARPTTRSRASRSTGGSSRRSRRRKMPVASIDGPDQYGFWTRNVWGDVEKRMLDAIGALGNAARRTATLRSSRRPPRRGQSAQLRKQLLPFTPKDNQPGFTSPVAYPTSDDDVPAPPRRPRRDARRRPARARRRSVGARACTTPTTTSRRSSRTG